MPTTTITPYTTYAYIRPVHGAWRDAEHEVCEIIASTSRMVMIDGRRYRLMRTSDGHLAAVFSDTK